MTDRRRDLDAFYTILDELRDRIGGYRHLRDTGGRRDWPARGVYFFFERGELREDGRDLRVVRVGTHAVSVGSRTTLWNRLAQHRGTTAGTFAGGGNHRGSIFRLHVGTALLNRGTHPAEVQATWGRGSSADRATRMAEYALERDVSAHIGAMPFLWLDVPDAAGKGSHRKIIESGAIALLSNRGRPAIDPPSAGWLGRDADRAAIRESGLWNVNHVDEYEYSALFELLARHLGATEAHAGPQGVGPGESGAPTTPGDAPGTPAA